MAREVVTYSWCDVCLDKDDKRVEGKEVGPLLLPGMRQPKSVDLCDEHYADLFAALAVVVEAHGKPMQSEASVKIPKRVQGSKEERDGVVFRCKVPGCTGYRARTEGLPSRDKLRGHAYKMHGMNLIEYQERYGIVQPEASGEPLQQPALPMEAEEPEEPPLECEVCGKPYPRGLYARPAQALGVHRARSHGLRSRRYMAEQEAQAAS